jgi:uracil-DNA glycosylase
VRPPLRSTCYTWWRSVSANNGRESALDTLQEAARHCTACPLYKNATQTVFGEGRATASLMLVGEQPGNEEDLEGKPFVGPAGKLLDDALDAAGIDRDSTYVTNTVKHFKWTPKGRMRLHKKPNRSEVVACLPWLQQEIELIRPKVLVPLGATAGQALLGPDFRVTKDRGQRYESDLVSTIIPTIHPSAILRARGDRERAFEAFVNDLAIAAEWLRNGSD